MYTVLYAELNLQRQINDNGCGKIIKDGPKQRYM